MSPRLRFKQVDFSLIERRRETLAVRVYDRIRKR
jgi:hypothetical protein